MHTQVQVVTIGDIPIHPYLLILTCWTCIALRHELGFVLDHFAGDILLQFEEPLQPDWSMSWQKGHQPLGLVALN
jgi:hypothetical protein